MANATNPSCLWFGSLIVCCFGCTNESEHVATDASAEVKQPIEQPADSVATLPQTDESIELRELARDALTAHGGEDALARLERGRITSDVIGNFAQGMVGRAVITDTFDGPTRFRREVDATTEEGQRIQTIFVINGDDAWMVKPETPVMRLPGPVRSHDNILLGSMKVLKSICDGDFSLEHAPDLLDDSTGVTPVYVMSGDKAVAGIVFDDDSKFVISSFKTLYDAITTSQYVSMATYFDDFQEVDGITIPTHITALRDQQPLIDTTIRKLELLDTIDASVFAKPKFD